MACGDYEYFVDAIKQEAFRDALLCPYQESMTGVVFAMIAYGTITTSLYIRTRSVLLPTVLTVVIGGITVTQIAAPAVALFTVVLLFIVGLAPVALIRRATSP